MKGERLRPGSIGRAFPERRGRRGVIKSDSQIFSASSAHVECEIKPPERLDARVEVEGAPQRYFDFVENAVASVIDEVVLSSPGYRLEPVEELLRSLFLHHLPRPLRVLHLAALFLFLALLPFPLTAAAFRVRF